MSKYKILVTLLVASTALSFIACSKEKKDTVKEDSKETIETITSEDEESNKIEEDSSEAEDIKKETQVTQQTTEDKKEENSKGTTPSNNPSNKEENKPTNVSNNTTNSNTQQQQNNNNNNGKEENSAPQQPQTHEPLPTPSPTIPTKTYKVRADLVGTVFNAVNDYTSTNLNKKLNLTGAYNAVGETYIAYRIGQGENPTAVNVKYTYVETDSINMITEMPEVVGDRYSGGNECSVVVVENNGMYSIVFVSKY